MVPTKILKYGGEWPADADPLDIEFECIRRGGTWKIKGVEYGAGLFHHYKEAQKLLWPTGEDHHRWSDLMLKTILEERITVCCGARDSGKTHVALSRFGLTDYFCFPDETLIIMSSTDTRGLQLRVWGDVKDLHRRALELRPHLAGKTVDSKFGIFTDILGEDCDTRDMRKGLVCVPCLDRNYGWTGGLEKYVGIKQKRRLLLGDECFPTGTLVDTPSGPVQIQTIKPGDAVINASGIGRVVGIRQSKAQSLTQITTVDGRMIHCTANHEFLTQKGWVKACQLTPRHYMLAAYEAMQVMRSVLSANRQGQVLQCVPQSASELSALQRAVYSQVSRRHQRYFHLSRSF